MTTCDSCGRDDELVVPVHRQYPVPGDAGPLGWNTVDDVEHWCAACCAHYPHEPAA